MNMSLGWLHEIYALKSNDPIDTTNNLINQREERMSGVIAMYTQIIATLDADLTAPLMQTCKKLCLADFVRPGPPLDDTSTTSAEIEI